jgi:hypothetical protein
VRADQEIMQSHSSRWFGAGRSVATDSVTAGTEAAAAAVDGRTPVLVFVFVSVAHDLPALLGAVRKEVGAGPVIVGSTTAGEISPAGPTRHGVAVGALGGDGFTVRTRAAQIGQEGDRAAGAKAAGALAGMDRPHSVLMLFCDGLPGNPNEIVRGAYSVAGAGVPLVGGFAGDDSRHRRTYQFNGVGENVDVLSGAVVGVALGSTQPVGVGVAHGWRRVEPPMIVTGSSGGTIMEIDGKPALDVLAERLGVEASAAGLFDTGFHAIGLSRRNGEDVRSLNAADDVTRSVTSGGGAEVPQGALFWLMESDRETLIDVARIACAEAIAGMGGAEPLGALAFDCAGRETALGDDGARAEVAAIREGLGGAPFAGLYTAGEVARRRGSLGMHHLTLVMLAVA